SASTSASPRPSAASTMRCASMPMSGSIVWPCARPTRMASAPSWMASRRGPGSSRSSAEPRPLRPAIALPMQLTASFDQRWPQRFVVTFVGAYIYTERGSEGITMGVTNALYGYGFAYDDAKKPYRMQGVVNSPDAVKGLEFYKSLYDCCTAPGMTNAYMQ